MGFISPIPTDTRGNPRTTGGQQVLGKDEFLQLLITKLRYQDPLKPVTDEDFVAQLAQFSTLEQMNQISEGISTSNQWDFLQMQSINNTMAANLIGKEVMASYGGVFLQADGNATISYTTDTFAQQIRFTIKNEAGETVASFTRDNVPIGSAQIEWDGRDSLGNRLPEGYYVVEATGVTEAGEAFEPKLSLVGIVQSITYKDGGAFLRVNGSDIALGDITSVGAPGAFTGNNEEDGFFPF
jgi:flagellar basal-body rod modification protein FlgD